MFEYGVILNGSQTYTFTSLVDRLFEYGVILNGSQTYTRLDYKIHYPLRKIINSKFINNDDDKKFINNQNTHVDFLIFSKLNKAIKLVIEVDGKQHKQEIQKKRDIRKDRLLNSRHINVLRLKTTDVYNENECKNIIRAALDQVYIQWTNDNNY